MSAAEKEVENCRNRMIPSPCSSSCSSSEDGEDWPEIEMQSSKPEDVIQIGEATTTNQKRNVANDKPDYSCLTPEDIQEMLSKVNTTQCSQGEQKQVFSELNKEFVSQSSALLSLQNSQHEKRKGPMRTELEFQESVEKRRDEEEHEFIVKLACHMADQCDAGNHLSPLGQKTFDDSMNPDEFYNKRNSALTDAAPGNSPQSQLLLKNVSADIKAVHSDALNQIMQEYGS